MTPAWTFPLLVLSAALNAAPTDYPPLPDAKGRAGMMAAVIRDARGQDCVLAAGGANFPDKMPWEGGTKVFYREIFLLEKKGAWTWRKVGDLPEPTAYAAFCASPDQKGLILAGGANGEHHLTQVLLIDANGAVSNFSPPLTTPRAYAGFTTIQGSFAMVGGSDKADATQALDTMTMLVLQNPDAGWKTNEADPDQARILAFMGSSDGVLVWGGGCRLFAQAGQPKRDYLEDLQHVTRQGQGVSFHGLGDKLAASAGPAVAVNGGFCLVGGDTGSHYGQPPATHPGHSQQILFIDGDTFATKVIGTWPTPLATAPLLRLGNDLLTISGETKPGVRTPATSHWTLPENYR